MGGTSMVAAAEAKIERRAFLAGLGATALVGRADAAPLPDRLFAGTPLARNKLAALFHRTDLALPDTRVLTGGGSAPLSRLTGKTRLVTLWAEWCVPCLIEAREIAALRPGVAGPAFDIVSVLTASAAKLDHAAAAARLRASGAGGLPLLVEPDGGRAVAQALGGSSPALPGSKSSFAFPCTLLVDRSGRVRGRATGMPTVASGPPLAGGPHTLTTAEKKAMLTNGTRSWWSLPEGMAFLQELAGGALDRI